MWGKMVSPQSYTLPAELIVRTDAVKGLRHITQSSMPPVDCLTHFSSHSLCPFFGFLAFLIQSYCLAFPRPRRSSLTVLLVCDLALYRKISFVARLRLAFVWYQKMQYSIIIALLLIVAASALFKKKGAAKKPKVANGVPKDAPPGMVTSLKPGGGRDMTWGGRPDPTPELFVEESKDAGGWLKAGWRYNKK